MLTHDEILARFNPARTGWHITVGAYCSRLHGGDRPTVDRDHNSLGEDFIGDDAPREEFERRRARGEPVWLTDEQRTLIEDVLPDVCERGGWTFHACAASAPPENNHFHILIDADPAIHGKDIRKWLKRWLTDALDEKFGRPKGGSWWVEDGSTKPVKAPGYFVNCFNYIVNQRTTAMTTR